MKPPRCDCWVESKRGHLYHPAMKRLYAQFHGDGKRGFKGVGWYCPHCKEVIID